jgi:hypothetical protein
VEGPPPIESASGGADNGVDSDVLKAVGGEVPVKPRDDRAGTPRTAFQSWIGRRKQEAYGLSKQRFVELRIIADNEGWRT